jgi:hypothetical protein
LDDMHLETYGQNDGAIAKAEQTLSRPNASRPNASRPNVSRPNANRPNVFNQES